MVKNIKQAGEKHLNIAEKTIESNINQAVRSLKASDPCSGAKSIDPVLGQYRTFTLQQGEYVCADLRDYYTDSSYIGFVAFGDGLKFEGYDENMNCQYTSEGAYASTYPLTRVTATVNTEVTYIAANLQKSTSQVTYNVYVIAQSSYSGTATISATSQSSSASISMDMYIYINPSGASIRVTSDYYSMSNVVTYESSYRTNQEATYESTLFIITAYPNEVTGGSSTRFTMNFEITSTSTPANYPNTNFAVLPSNLYGRSTNPGCSADPNPNPDDNPEGSPNGDPDDDGLSTGAIVGIVVAVVVVVGVVVFCVVWFVVLKKSCGSSSHADAEV